MEAENKKNVSQLFNFTKDSYLERTSRPFYAIIFLLPFIIAYELGTIFINTDLLNQSQVRVVAFVWLQHFLGYLGFGEKFAWAAPAVAVIVILFALHIAARKQWFFSIGDFLPMILECIVWAIPLIVLSVVLNNTAANHDELSSFNNSSAYVQNQLVSCSNTAETFSQEKGAIEFQEVIANIVTSVGAGIYEEMVFRLILIILLMILFQDVLRFEHKRAVICSVLFSAALFSAYHHIDFLSGQMTEPFNLTVFGFRTLAGVYFAGLFAIRGFAITAGTHAFYDIIVVLLNAYFLQQ